MELVTVKTQDEVYLDAAWYPNPDTRLGVILIHGKGQNFYTSVARWLAPYLSTMGFSSLALNMRDHDHSEIDGLSGAVQDIDAGVRFLVQQGIKKYLLVGISYGSNKAALYLSEEINQDRLLGLIFLSAGGIKTYLPDLWTDVLHKLHKSRFPILVIQAGADEHVPNPKEAGEEIIDSAGNSDKAQMVLIQGANHGFVNHQEEVYGEIKNWLFRNNFST
jgi:pimeloyl-ACP methyl ester carboxylesterase